MPRWIRVLPVGPCRQCVPILVHQQDLRVFAAFAKFMSSIDREKHRFPLGLVWAVLFAIELDGPNVALTNN